MQFALQISKVLTVTSIVSSSVLLEMLTQTFQFKALGTLKPGPHFKIHLITESMKNLEKYNY